MTKYGPESKDLWIQARVEELMDDEDFFKEWCAEHDYEAIEVFATRTATREHAEIEAMTFNAQVDNLELK